MQHPPPPDPTADKTAAKVVSGESSTNTAEFLKDALDRNERWISLADAKAGVVSVAIPGLAVLFGATVMEEVRRQWKDVRDWNGMCSEWLHLSYLILAALIAVCALVAITNALQVITPRLGPANGRSLIYFRDIAGRSLGDWQQELTLVTDDSIENEYVRQVHITAGIALVKYQHVRRSIIASGGFLATSVLAYILTFI